MEYNLSRFTTAHQSDYHQALVEIKNGRKLSHWMWYIFPQLKGLGRSSTSDYYGIHDLDEAKAFLQDEYLGPHLLEISNALLRLECNDARIIMGRPDDLKLKSSMTLFSIAAPQEQVFKAVLEKFFYSKPDYRTLRMLGIQEKTNSNDKIPKMDEAINRIIKKEDNNIHQIRAKYPNGLHFVVGDTHGEYETLRKLLEKIEFDPQKDFVYFVGDYNAGGNPKALLQHIAQYYQENHDDPGFHLIRGNHERELWPFYELPNLPDIFVLKGQNITFYLTHAGMVQKAFDMINMDIKNLPVACCQAYALDNNITCYDAPFRQIIWSRRGLYSQRSRYHVWPSEESLRAAKACIIHGHTPFSQLKHGDYFSYGDNMLLWEKQRIWFAEDLQSFDIDSNVKGRFDSDDYYRGLSCICLEIVDEIASKNDGFLLREAMRESENFAFSVPYTPNVFCAYDADLSPILEANPKMKRIVLAADGNPQIID